MVLDKATTRYVSLMLTHRCNLNCSYCYEQFKSAKTMSIDVAKSQITKAFCETRADSRYKALELSFMGGEPLMEFENIRILSEWCWQQDWGLPYIIFASTNGTLLTDEMKEWFYENRERIVLGISLDGSLDMQKTNRGELASKIDIDFFLKSWPLQGIKATISRETLATLADGVKFLHQTGFEQIYANLAYGVEWTDEDLGIYKDQLLNLVDYYLLLPEINRCSLLSLDLTEIVDLSLTHVKHCGCGTGTTLIDVDEQVYPCPVFSPCTLPNDKLDGLKDINFNDITQFIPSECKNCVIHRACPKCYGMNYLLTGKVNSFNRFGCKAFKIQVLANCYLQERLLKAGLCKDSNTILAALHLLNAIL